MRWYEIRDPGGGPTVYQGTTPALAATIEDTMPPEQSAKRLAFADPQIDRAAFSASTMAWP